MSWQRSAIKEVNDWVHNYTIIFYSLGNGVFGLEPAGSSLCNLGPKDTLPSADDSEAFIALHVYNENNQLFINTQYNQDDYTADREKHGYICEKESKNIIYKYNFDLHNTLNCIQLVSFRFSTLDSAFPLFMFLSSQIDLPSARHLRRSQHEKWKGLIRVDNSQQPQAGQKNTISNNKKKIIL